MGKFIVHGFVPDIDDHGFDIRVENVRELVNFWHTEQITTGLRRVNDIPTIAVRKHDFVKKCQPGDKVKLTIESVERRTGIGIRGVDLEVISRSKTL